MSNISVVIPTLNEEKYIEPLLEQLQNCSGVIEIIVSDGGSSDGTFQISKQYNKVSWVNSRQGRARQMNAGAIHAKGEILLFLHADSTIYPMGIQHISSKLTHHFDAGSFYLKFDIQGFWLNIYSWFSKCDWTIFTYGDQGLFIKKSFFQKIGGFRDIPIMEDLDIVRRIKQQGTFQKINFPIITCARRFKKHGVVFQQLKNVFIVTLYYLGASPNWLSKFYKY